MLVTVYPNNEVRARIPSPPLTGRKLSNGVKPRYLVNRSKLATIVLPPIEACRYKSCPVKRPGYGGLPGGVEFSVYARRMLSRAGGVFAPSSEKRTVFLTGTLPGGTEAAFRAIAEHSSWMVHSVMRQIPRIAGIKAADLVWQWVWEFQKRGALHWHGVIEFPSGAIAQKVIDSWRRLWSSVLRGVSKRSGVDIFERRDGGTHKDNESAWRIDAQVARKSPQRYLSKYLGKSEGKDKKAGQFYPTRWYGMSRKTASLLREKTRVFFSRRSSHDPHFLVNDEDLGLLSRLSTLSSKVVAFSDKVKTGVTVVFYPNEGTIDVVNEVLSVMDNSLEVLRKVFATRVSVPVRAPKVGSWLALGMVRVRPHICENFFMDIGEYYRSLFLKWLKGEEIPDVEGFWLNHYASQTLYRAGVLAAVIPPEPCGAGLTDESKNTGKRVEEGVSGELFPGMPF